jgi:nucleoside-diphosphate-sugar epimerase
MVTCKGPVGVIGATSLLGYCLLPLLIEDGYDVVAFSRRVSRAQQPPSRGVVWRLLSVKYSRDAEPITKWICLAPIWVLPEYLPLLLHYGVKHIVAVSSTSRFTKGLSSDTAEKELAAKLIEGEQLFMDWAEKNQVNWTILRPTLTYGLGRDKNVSVIARFIRRFAFFPLFGEARGLRQPVHVHDVALGCVAALSSEKAFNHSYNISGGEMISYREMVGRVFSVIGRKPRFVILPLCLFRLAVMFLRLLPRFRHWSPAIAERMNLDLVFDHTDARRDLGFTPRPFRLSIEDIPK